MTFWSILKSITLCKNCCSIYLVNFWKHLGYNFTPISGRTGCRSRSSQNSIKDWFHGSNTVIWQILLTINFFKEAEIVSTFKKQKKFLPILIFKVQIFIRYHIRHSRNVFSVGAENQPTSVTRSGEISK